MLKKIDRIIPRSQKLRNLKKPNLLNGYSCNYKSCITYAMSCYTCQWKEEGLKKSEDGSCCYSWLERLFFPFLIASFGLSLIFLFMWAETSNEYFGFNWAIFLNTGIWFFWSLVLLSTAVIVTVYSTLLLVFACLLVQEGYELYLHWCHKVFAPYLHLSCIIVMIILSWPVALYLAQLEREARLRSYRMTAREKRKLRRCNVITKLKALQVAIGLPFILILLFLYLMPLGIYSPCILEKEKLGPKPGLFGHRGAPMDGPENTMMSFEKAVEQGAFGLETDIFLSLDRVPFLMHDQDLRRTTNIEEVLPQAAFNSCAFFRWNFLSMLNAGEWFLNPRRRPYFIMKYLSETDKNKARKQTIPKLSSLLKLAKKEKKFVIFDLHRPPPKHPLRDTYVRRVVKVILDSQIEQNLIYWLPGLDRAYVKQAAPGFQQVGRLFTIENLKEENITIINVDYKKLLYSGLKYYKEANITINLYIINEPWLYSMAWCSRVHSVTTDNIEILKQLDRPYFFMTPSYYMILWLLLDIFSAIAIFTIFNFHWWKERKREEMLKSTSIPPGSGSLGPQQSKSESQESSSLSQQAQPQADKRPWIPAVFFAPKTYKTKKYSGSRKTTFKKQTSSTMKSPGKPSSGYPTAPQEPENVNPPVLTTIPGQEEPKAASVPQGEPPVPTNTQPNADFTSQTESTPPNKPSSPSMVPPEQ
ncbi:glycerophosphodiester phosphodiesterase domain-containing protein 4 isoform X2 [Dasypus novemcinctus]|uniref:glycerophosphodiester phosphodiesterase domain-containing protein 4 isoform X2 n=1 Tax=Dasypus novemcinctus TaxID=9361 RepID=UPI00265E0A6A|nr:glycerophosphodiester phosphodiesterase domain-containing protein 4 isoform X2 [Dasypus novemcinctus]